jgi:hypothetical protein
MNIISQQGIPGLKLTYVNFNHKSARHLWPDIIYVDVKHNAEMASFVCQGQPQSVPTKDIICTDNAQQIFGGEM